VTVRRERPHPGAQLDAIEERDGYRYTAHATDTRTGQHAWLDARHRAHARVEDRIRCGRATGLGRLPSRAFAINAAWLAATMIANDLLAFTRTLLLHDTLLARAEPKTLRYRLLHVAARLTRGQRRLWLRIDQHWPWARELAAAFARLAVLPTPPAKPAT
jgi:DDE family transposase